MAINFVNSIDLNKNELQNAVIQNVTAIPSGGTYSEGQAAYNTNSNDLIIYNGSDWEQVGGSFTLRADGPSGANTFEVTPGSTVSLLGGTNMSVDRGSGVNSSIFTITTTATPDQTITLTGAVTGSGTGSFVTTLQQVVDTSKIVASALTKSDEDFAAAGEGSSGDLQLPTTKSVYNYVNLVATGNLKFMGGFNASSGAITSGPNSGDDISEGIAVAVGDYYVVTVGGDFANLFGQTPAVNLTPGDNIIAVNAVTAGSTISLTDWSIVQADRDVATATTIGAGNTTAGATSGIDVAYASPSTGTATLSLDLNEIGSGTGAPVTLAGTDSNGATKKFTESDVHSARGKKIPLTTGTGIASAASGGITTWTITLSSAWQSGIDGTDCMVEVYKVSDASTVYAEVARTSTLITVKFTGTAASGTYGVLLQNVG